MSSRQDAKNEKILRELLRLPDNKRCPNCDSLGPQYVVSQFNVFVCTVCSGIHREFGHRVKGISMSTFKSEEITALKDGGNGAFAAQFLAKWSQTQLPKPTDRHVDRIKEWIRDVYESKRFFDSSNEYSPHSVNRQASKPEGKIVVRQLSDVMGLDTPKLHVSRTASVEKKSSTQSTSQSNGHIVNLLDVASPKAAVSKAPAEKPGAEAWDAFASAQPTQAAPAADNGWAAFGEQAPAPASSNQPAATTVQSNGLKQVSQPEVASSAPWEAFGEQLTAAATAISSPSPSMPASAAQPQVAEQPPKKEERREVPLDIFFPEFEQIRATGLLPNGQPALVPLRPQGYAGAQAQQAYMQQPYSSSVPGAGYHHQAGAGHPHPGAPRPSVVIPASMGYPHGMMPSPAGGLSPASLTSPGSYGLSTYSSAGGMSPAGSAASHHPYTNGSLHGHADPAGLRASVSSEASSTGFQQHSSADPFSSLAPGFKAALPPYGVAPAQPAPASLPPASPVPAAGLSVSVMGGAPAVQAGSPFGASSLYSGPPSLSAMPYDLSAPAAPKARASGNPFA